MRRSTRPREAVSLSKSVQHQVNMYALAASAAGVNMLALSQSADAKIVYTPAHHLMRVNQSYNLDLNHDGTTDFRLTNKSSTFGHSAGGVLYLRVLSDKNGVAGYMRRTFSSWASALPPGVSLGPKRRFFYPGTGAVAFTGWNAYEKCNGPWHNVKNHYLGMKFLIQGKPHFGWARLNASCSPKVGGVTGLLTGYAYETIPNKPIVTGKTKGSDVVVEPATLGHLAAGTSGPHKVPASPR